MDRTDTLCPTCSLIHWTPCNAPHEHSPAGCPDDGLDCHPPARTWHDITRGDRTMTACGMDITGRPTTPHGIGPTCRDCKRQ